MAGLGTRLRPHTWSKPKPLVTTAGKSVLGHVLDIFSTLPDPENVELIFIVGYLGEQVEAYVQEHYPSLTAHYVQQAERRGQSHALYLARQHLTGPMMMIFVDTLIEADLSVITQKPEEAVAWVKEVEDPTRFGVAETDESGRVTRLIEKPDDLTNNLALVGFYYFPQAEDLLSAIEEQMEKDIQTKGEYYLADAVNLLLARGVPMRVETVDIWMDAGLPETVLETNRYLLDNGRGNSEEAAEREDVLVLPPVFIHPTAEIKESVIGPHVSVGAGCRITRSLIRDSVLEDEVEVTDAVLSASLIGRKAQVKGHPHIINQGDDSQVTL